MNFEARNFVMQYDELLSKHMLFVSTGVSMCVRVSAQIVEFLSIYILHPFNLNPLIELL